MKFKKSFLASAALAAVLIAGPVRAQTCDVAFQFRMGAGFPGDVNRTHPASIVPGLQNVATPILLYGNPCVVDTATNSYRQLATTDTAVTVIDGILVRPYPVQQSNTSQALGPGAPPATGAIDVLKDGYVIATCNNFAVNAPTLKGPVYIWIAASTGAHVQGTFEAGAGGGSNTVLVANAQWNGPPDANGISEIHIWSSKQ